MPLSKAKTKAAFSRNVATEVKAGRPTKQAVAIAFATRREAAVNAASTPKRKTYPSDSTATRRTSFARR